MILLILVMLLMANTAYAHTGTLDAYGCHSNTALYGTSAKRECHTGLLAGQVFASSTAEYKAMIAALQLEVKKLQAQLPKTLTLSWQANTEPDLAGYRVYCGTASHVYTINQDAKQLTALTLTLPSGTYYCAVTAYDTANNESTFSGEVSKVIP